MVGDLEEEEFRVVVDITDQQMIVFCRVCCPVVCRICLFFKLALLELGGLAQDFVSGLLSQQLFLLSFCQLIVLFLNLVLKEVVQLSVVHEEG